MARDKEITQAYQNGFKSGARIKYGKYSFDQLLNDSDRFRREYNRRVKLAIKEAKKIFTIRGN